MPDIEEFEVSLTDKRSTGNYENDTVHVSVTATVGDDETFGEAYAKTEARVQSAVDHTWERREEQAHPEEVR